MKIRFLNNTDADFTDVLKNMVAFYAKHNITLEVEFTKVNVPISTITYKTSQGFNSVTGKPEIVSWIGLTQSVKDSLRPNIQNCDIVMFPYNIGALVNPDVVYTNWTDGTTINGARFIQLVYNPYLLSSGEFQTACLHEPMHALCYDLTALGYPIHDYMDIDKNGNAFYLNSTPDDPNSNFSQTFNSINPYLSHLQSPSDATLPVVTITRNSDDGKQILGTLSANNFHCNTLELSYRNNQANVSAIPKGTYRCEWKFMFDALTYHYQILNIPNRNGIFLHKGNYWMNSKGCILLGNTYSDINKDGEIDILNSTITTDSFEKMMNRQPFTLTIQ